MIPRRRPARAPGFPIPAFLPARDAAAIARINAAAARMWREIEAAVGGQGGDAANRARQQARLDIDRAAQWAVVALFECSTATGAASDARTDDTDPRG